ncbi:MAG: hypothetical protein ACRCYY_16460, partial [Trueperaceae bacterium]
MTRQHNVISPHDVAKRRGARLVRQFLGSLLIVLLLALQSVQAQAKRSDWCGKVWSIESLKDLAWINPTSGVTTSASGPTLNITMPSNTPGTSVAAIGIHNESGTMFAFDRAGTTGTLYKYRLGVDTAWQALSVSGLLGTGGIQSIANASNNLNKMTVDSNTLLIAESNGVAVYSVPLNSSGTPTAGASVATYTYVGDPMGTPAHRSLAAGEAVGTTVINGGDITTDEFGDVYNITYNVTVTVVSPQATSTSKAYFYKQNGNTWVYQGETSATSPFAGAAFYKGDLFVKATGQLKRVDLTRSGSGYTGWNNALIDIGSAST